ncbi:MAG: WG repeat-containing protein [Chitinophagales bacterium]
MTVVNKGALYDMMSFEWTEGKWGFIDKTGKEVIPFKYDGDITNYQKKEPK